LSETQRGFRKGKSTLHNIFVLSYVAQRRRNIEEKERKIYAFFADFKAAFDNVDRGTQWKILRKKG